MRMTDWHIVLLAGAYHLGHPFQHFGMLILTRVAEFLGKIAFADQDGGNTRHLLKYMRKCLDPAHILHHQDHEDFPFWIERPYIGALIVLLLRYSPVANRRARPIAANTGGLE